MEARYRMSYRTEEKELVKIVTGRIKCKGVTMDYDGRTDVFMNHRSTRIYVDGVLSEEYQGGPHKAITDNLGDFIDSIEDLAEKKVPAEEFLAEIGQLVNNYRDRRIYSA
ncbi:hypothetical protein KW787_00910 [Candidatus Pacearchaeota archaeon]|nr:hypothetical protein [Candidatus Pacearchaeota archaeon]